MSASDPFDGELTFGPVPEKAHKTPAGHYVVAVHVTGWAPRIVSVGFYANGSVKLGRPSNCYHGRPLRIAFVQPNTDTARAEAEAACRLCVYEVDRLGALEAAK